MRLRGSWDDELACRLDVLEWAEETNLDRACSQFIPGNTKHRTLNIFVLACISHLLCRRACACVLVCVARAR